MGTVAVTLKIMPSSTEVDLEEMKKKIEETISNFEQIKLEQINEKPVAFGLKSLSVLFTMPDSGGTDEVEKALSSIENVESVETENITLV